MSYLFDDRSQRPPPGRPPPPFYPYSLPKIGQTRCYWALLSSELHFIYLDPVLASHLEEQADHLVGRSLLAFVHPDEQASAKQDLGGVLESRTLHGSVTRVRFSRLTKVRQQLGYDGPPHFWPGQEKVVLDKDYMAVDIVINWAAEGLVLCFIHATVDLTPDDNDENKKSDWTNWCGTPSMPQEQVELLYRSLLGCVPQTGAMSRVFQILANQRERPLLMSWPPDPAQGPISRDFAKLVENVQIGNGLLGGNDAKTSCTRRYKALQDMHSVLGGEVESIFIPHDSIIFACHKICSNSRSDPTPPMQQVDYYSPHQTSSYYDHPSSYALPPLSPQTTYNGPFIPQQGPGVPSYPQQRWQQASLPPGASPLRSASYPAPSPTQTNQSWTSGPPSASYMEPASTSPFSRPLSPGYSYSPTATGSSTGASPTSDVVPPPRRRISPASAREGSTRSAGNRPSGVQKCSSCKATSSPEWRKGPSGKKELCNACGLRYARSRAKKEGPAPTQQRRRKEKGTKRDSATPPSSSSAPQNFPTLRRNYAESNISASSAGSASGSDIHSHSGHTVIDNVTPSPSPPASSMNFVHYAPSGADNRPPYSGTSSNFYPVPPPTLPHHPLSHPHPQQQSQPQPQAQHITTTTTTTTTQLPPLGQLSSYSRLSSSMMPPGSPVSHPHSHSSLTSPSVMIPASYERDTLRERERDFRELPPTPMSVEPRLSRRSILTHQ